MIHGKPFRDYPKFLFQIVANAENGIDSDKLDYLQRDGFFTHLPAGFQCDRIIKNSRVIDDSICFHAKTYGNILQMFQTRYYFHREVYQHHTVLVLESMMLDILKLSIPELNLEERFKDPEKWGLLDDQGIIHEIRSNPKLTEAHAILERIERRQLYRTVKRQPAVLDKATKSRTVEEVDDEFLSQETTSESTESSVPSSSSTSSQASDEPLPTPPNSPPRLVTSRSKSDTSALVNGGSLAVRNATRLLASPSKHIIMRSTMGYTNSAGNPLDKVWFFRGDDNNQKCRIKATDFSVVMPNVFSEVHNVHIDKT